MIAVLADLNDGQVVGSNDNQNAVWLDAARDVNWLFITVVRSDISCLHAVGFRNTHVHNVHGTNYEIVAKSRVMPTRKRTQATSFIVERSLFAVNFHFRKNEFRKLCENTQSRFGIEKKSAIGDLED